MFTWSIDRTTKNDEEDATQCCLVEAEGIGRGWKEVGLTNDIGRGRSDSACEMSPFPNQIALNGVLRCSVFRPSPAWLCMDNHCMSMVHARHLDTKQVMEDAKQKMPLDSTSRV
jgi:hypothetical protein